MIPKIPRSQTRFLTWGPFAGKLRDWEWWRLVRELCVLLFVRSLSFPNPCLSGVCMIYTTKTKTLGGYYFRTVEHSRAKPMYNCQNHFPVNYCEPGGENLWIYQEITCKRGTLRLNNILLEVMSNSVLVSGVEPCRVCCCWLHIVLMGDTWMVQWETMVTFPALSLNLLWMLKCLIEAPVIISSFFSCSSLL